MSYNPYTSSSPPRPLRIMLGGTLAIACLIFGMMFAVHAFHQALVMQGDPQVMDWDSLVQRGYGDNCHIRLNNVSIVDPYLESDEFFGEEEFEEMMENPILRSHMDFMEVGPAKVIPIGADPEQTPRRIVIAAGRVFVDEGYRQVDENDSLTGMVSTYGVDQMVFDVLKVLTGNEVMLPPDQGEEVYTIIPVDGAPDLAQNRNLFLCSGFGLALGLIFCGSGGPGFWTVWFAPVPSLMSLIGYPMRYGRGGKSTRAFYALAGVSAMGYGYYLMAIVGKIGAADGNPIFHAFGFVLVFSGLAAVMAVPLQITFRALSESVECQPRKKAVRMSWQQACSMDPVEQEVEYEDQQLVRSPSLPLSGDLKKQATEFESSGFSQGESMQWQNEEGVRSATIQLGCQDMVIAESSHNQDADLVETRLVSVMGTGVSVVTVSANSAIEAKRPTGNCLFHRAASSVAKEMLAEHLELVIGEAERRDTILVEFSKNELHDGVQLGRRVIAELKEAPNGVIVRVGHKQYGRFHFPAAPIADLESV